MIRQTMTVEEIEADIVQYIENWYANPPPHSEGYRPKGIPTFRNLQTRYGKQGIGQVAMYLSSHPSVVLWQGLSQSLAQAFSNLLTSGAVHWHWAFLVFYEEGGPLPLPEAAWPVTNEYGKPHWLPVVFKPGERCDDDIGCPNYTGTGEEDEERFETA